MNGYVCVHCWSVITCITCIPLYYIFVIKIILFFIVLYIVWTWCILPECISDIVYKIYFNCNQIEYLFHFMHSVNLEFQFISYNLEHRIKKEMWYPWRMVASCGQTFNNVIQMASKSPSWVCNPLSPLGANKHVM